MPEPGSASQYMERSATIGTSACTLVDRSAFGCASLTRTVLREFGGIVKGLSDTGPLLVM